MLATYRIKYGRYDGVKYIAHLDMLRLFARAARRCYLPMAFSQGFNPHPMFVFGLPIPVGTTSEDEYVDITLTEDMEPQLIIDKMNAVMPKSVRLLGAKLLPDNAPNIMKSVVASKYRVSGNFTEEEYETILQKAKETEPLVVEKRTKSGTRPTDIRPMIFKVERQGDYLIVTTAAGNEMNLRPELAVNSLAGHETEITKIHRLALLEKEDL